MILRGEVDCITPSGHEGKDKEFFARAKDIETKHARITAFGSTRFAKNKVEADPNVHALVEAGTPAIAEVIGLGAALRYVRGVGFDAIGAWERALGSGDPLEDDAGGASHWRPAAAMPRSSSSVMTRASAGTSMAHSRLLATEELASSRSPAITRTRGASSKLRSGDSIPGIRRTGRRLT